MIFMESLGTSVQTLWMKAACSFTARIIHLIKLPFTILVSRTTLWTGQLVNNNKLELSWAERLNNPFFKFSFPCAEMEAIVYGKVTACFKESDSLARSIPLVIMAFGISVTIVFQLIALQLSYFKLRNIILWLFQLGLLITAFPTEAAFKFQFQIAAVWQKIIRILGNIIILRANMAIK